MNFIVSLYCVLLFIVLPPGLIVSIPFKGKSLITVGVHAIIFAIIFHFTHKAVWRFSIRNHLEGFDEGGTGGKGKGHWQGKWQGKGQSDEKGKDDEKGKGKGKGDGKGHRKGN